MGPPSLFAVGVRETLSAAALARLIAQRSQRTDQANLFELKASGPDG